MSRAPPSHAIAGANGRDATLRPPPVSATTWTQSRFPYDAYDDLEVMALPVPGARLKVAFAPGPGGLDRTTTLAWIAYSATAIASYFGRFPLPTARVLVVPWSGRGVRRGQAFPYRGGAIRVQVGRESTPEDLKRDWMMVHEMVHLALPQLRPERGWLHEGAAVYVESIARVQAGHLPAGRIWRDFMDDMPKGLPGPADRGLDRTPTWGRTYWGGAIFYLLADIAMRRQTANRRGMQHALRAVLAAGGRYTQIWPVERLLATADRGTDTQAMSSLYREMSTTPLQTDLDLLWHELGIQRSGRGVRFDEKAPLAAIRRAITEPLPTTP